MAKSRAQLARLVVLSTAGSLGAILWPSFVTPANSLTRKPECQDAWPAPRPQTHLQPATAYPFLAHTRTHTHTRTKRHLCTHEARVHNTARRSNDLEPPAALVGNSTLCPLASLPLPPDDYAAPLWHSAEHPFVRPRPRPPLPQAGYQWHHNDVTGAGCATFQPEPLPLVVPPLPPPRHTTRH